MVKVKALRDGWVYRGDHKKDEVFEIPDDLAEVLLGPSWPDHARLVERVEGEKKSSPSSPSSSFGDNLDDQERKLEDKIRTKAGQKMRRGKRK